MSDLSSMFGVKNVAIPDEGPKCIRADLDFSSEASITIEGLLATTTGTMSYIQGVFIDNQNNDNPVQLQCNVTGQVITCPANSQGYFPLLITNPPRFVASTIAVASLRVKMFFYNVPIQPMVWGPDGLIVSISGAIDVSNQGPTLTDFSNIALDGTSEEVIAIGQAASYLAMFAPIGNVAIVNVNLAGGDALASFIELVPGGSVTIESGVANAITVAAINVGDAIMIFGG